MSHEDEVENDDAAYERWFKSTPQYWCELTDELTANVIAGPDCDCDSFEVSGTIES